MWPRLACVFATLIVAPTLENPALARDNEPKYGSPPLAYSAVEEPKWLDRVLKKLVDTKPWPIKQRMLFKDIKGRPTFLAVVRSAISRDFPKREAEQVFELYKVRVITEGNVRLTFHREVRDRYLKIDARSGFDIAGDGRPFLFLHYGHGGSDASNYGARVYTLERSLIDRTPDWAGRTARVTGPTKSDSPLLVVSDDRWANFFHGCGACGPRAIVLMKWNRSTFRPVCRENRDYYLKVIADFWKVDPDKLDDDFFERLANKPTHEFAPFLFYMQDTMDIVLRLLQIGQFEKANKVYETAVAYARKNSRQDASTVAFAAEWLDSTEKHFRPVMIAAATEGRNLACPVMAYEGGAPNDGFQERVEYFRYRGERGDSDSGR